MDVSRIEAFRPSRIDWKNLTAREIMKYKQQGLEVPNLYYQWAIGFLNDVDNARNDDVTYAAAKSETRHGQTPTSQRTETGELIKVEDSETTDTTETTETTNQTDETLSDEASVVANAGENADPNPPLSKAQAKRKDMVDKGVSLRSMGLSFSRDSIKASAESIMATIMLNFTQNQSNDEIGSLDGQIQEITSEALTAKNELKNVIASFNKDGGGVANLSKIGDLQKELQNYGIEGQQMISVSEGVLNGYDSDIASKTNEITDGKDFGAETIDIGNELIKEGIHGSFWENILDLIIGNIAVENGSASVDNSEICEGIQSVTGAVNTANISLADGMKHTIQVLTGVEGGDKGKADNETANRDPIDGKTDEADKDIKTSQNDGNDTNDKLNTDINEILKRKIRKGENINEPTA